MFTVNSILLIYPNSILKMLHFLPCQPKISSYPTFETEISILKSLWLGSQIYLVCQFVLFPVGEGAIVADLSQVFLHKLYGPLKVGLHTLLVRILTNVGLITKDGVSGILWT